MFLLIKTKSNLTKPYSKCSDSRCWLKTSLPPASRVSLPISNICSNKMTDQAPGHRGQLTLTPAAPAPDVWSYSMVPARSLGASNLQSLNVNVYVQSHEILQRPRRLTKSDTTCMGIHHHSETHPKWSSRHWWCPPCSKSGDCPSWRYRDKSHLVTASHVQWPVRSNTDYWWDRSDLETGCNCYIGLHYREAFKKKEKSLTFVKPSLTPPSGDE